MYTAKRAAFYTLGCKVNQYETESVKNQLLRHGFEIVDFSREADYYIVNTCTVTSIADKKSRNMLRRAKKTNRNSKLIVTGCYAQTNGKDLLPMTEIDYIVGNSGKENLLSLILALEENPETATQPRFLSDPVFSGGRYRESEPALYREMSRAYIKIQDGCDNFCAYCKIPFARGRSRSRDLRNILEEIRTVAAEGYKEAIVIGINLGAYGLDLPEKLNFTAAMEKILEENLIERIRIGSVYPDQIDDDFIRLFRHKTLMPHLHVSLQSCDDTVLRNMKRHYDAKTIERGLTALKSTVPLMEFTGDVIVGFPGETDRMFQNTCELIERIGFAGLHVFPYSDREHTAAAALPDKAPGEIKRERARILGERKKRLAAAAREKYVGRTLSVLIEAEKGGFLYGYSENYLKTRIRIGEDCSAPAQINTIRRVMIHSIEKEMLTSNG